MAAGDAEPAGDEVEAERERRARLVHDLRTPLTIVGGFADLLERGGDEIAPERRAEFVTRIADGARELRRILDEERDGRL